MAGIKGMHKRASTSAAYAEAVRSRIRAGGIVKRLEDHIVGRVEMSATQVSAALGLLRKVVPDLQGVQHSGEVAVKHHRTSDLVFDKVLERAEEVQPLRH